MKKLKIAGIVLILFILYVIIGMLVPFVHMQSEAKQISQRFIRKRFIQHQTKMDQTEQRSSVIIRKHLICGWI